MLMPAHGGIMGPSYTDDCPAGQVVRGYAGEILNSTANGGLDWLQVLCGTLSVVNTGSSCEVVVSAGTTLPMRGNAVGDPPLQQTCPANQVVVGFHGRSGDWIDQFAVDCAPLVITKFGASYQVSQGPVTSYPATQGNPAGGSPYADLCPSDQAAGGTVIRLRVTYPNQIALSCTSVTAQ
jgi:hypothetical protein